MLDGVPEFVCQLKKKGRLDEFHFSDFIDAGPTRRGHFGFIAFTLADQSARHWRGVRDFALGNIRLVFADNLIGRFFFSIDINDADRCATHDFVAFAFVQIDQNGKGALGFPLNHPAFNEGLLFLGGMVLGVLFEVAVCARLVDLLLERRAVLRRVLGLGLRLDLLALHDVARLAERRLVLVLLRLGGAFGVLFALLALDVVGALELLDAGLLREVASVDVNHHHRH